MMALKAPIRFKVSSLVLSAVAFVGIAMQEGFNEKAYVPIEGDKITIGFGTTEDVKVGDKTTPTKALAMAIRDINKFEGALKRCVTVPLHQHEYDAFVSIAYNVGPGAFCKSGIVRKLNAMDYDGACAEIMRWRFFQGKDCAIPANKCSGLYSRRKIESEQCRGAP